MQMTHSEFPNSPSMRKSLKRGISRQAISDAAQDTADFAQIFMTAQEFRPNGKSIERVGARLLRLPGVVRLAKAQTRGKMGLALLARNVHEIVTHRDGVEAFRETGLIYTRIFLNKEGAAVSRASFIQHALERMIERSGIQLTPKILSTIDTEAFRLLTKMSRGEIIEDDGDHFIGSGAAGIWAGSLDQMAQEKDHDRAMPEARAVPVFSVRTFLGPDEMRPTVWVRWQNDPACTIA